MNPATTTPIYTSCWRCWAVDSAVSTGRQSSVGRSPGMGTTTPGRYVFVFDTGGRGLAQCNFSIDDSAVEDTRLILRDLSFELTVDDDSAVNESIDGTVEGKASNRPITLELRDSDGDTVGGSRTETTLNGQGEYEFTYDPFDTGLDLAAGNYTVFVTDEYSWIDRESATIRVAQRDDGDTGFSKRVITDTRRDIVEVPVETF